MHFFAAVFTAVFTAVALAAPAFAGPTPLHSIEKFEGKTSGRYIVKLKDGVSKSGVFRKLRNSTVTHNWTLINGFAGYFDDANLNHLRASPEVEYITEDGIVYTSATQTNAPWGLARLSQVATLDNQDYDALTFKYTYDATAGKGVDIYIIDTGVYTTHSQFGGRARWGKTFGAGYADADGNGHGTHVAGTAAGSQYGVAKAANVIAVKVLSDTGSGYVSDVISGVNWVATTAASSGRPSIASLSIGASASTVFDNAVTALTTKGIHVTVAAGNSYTDAKDTSPARAPAVITVGASTIADDRAWFSNYGAVVDIFAPGENVISSWIGSRTDSNSISGTSMATPHVAGLVAYLIAKDGNTSPASMAAKIKNLSVKDALTYIPSGTVNYLAHNA